MSLKVWLPLNGDLRNNGLYNITVTNDGATVDNNGKIGKCYSFNNTHIIIDSTDLQNLFSSNTQPFSFATWIYLNSDETDRVIIFGNYNSDPFVNWELQANGAPRLCVGGVSNYTTRVASTAVPKTTWTHIACTYDGSVTTFYMNGEKTNSVNGANTITAKASGNRFFLGSDHRNDATRLKGRLNDFRLYDHVLSPKEVKMISQGMILHYPLSREGFGADNIINGTSSTEVQYTYPSTSYNDFYSRKTTIVPSASQYILSFDAKSTVAGDKIRAHYYSPNTTTRCESSQGIVNTASDGNMDFTLSTEWERYWVVYTQSSTTAAKSVILPRMCSKASGMAATGSGTVSIKRVKFEEGDKPTPWIPNQSDTAYAAMGLNDDVVYDTSGFSYNATKSGTFEYTSDTPKYSVSTKLLTTSSKIRLPEISFAGMANSYTFSWWQYYNGGGTMPWGFSNGNRLNFYHCSPVCWNTGDGASNPFKNGSTTLPPANLQNGWHHIAVTGDGTTTKLYIDGAYFGNATAYRPITGTQIWISGWDSGTSYTFSGGKLSDFRIYATALSADDIKELYDTPISLTSNGTLMTHGEYTEV